MRSLSVVVSAAALLASLFALDAAASAVLYTQDPSGAGLSSSAILNASGDPGFNWTTDTDQQSWAYFNTASAGSFNRISWYGTASDGNFAVDLYAATCFSCSAAPVPGSGAFASTLLPNAGPFSQAQVHQTLVAGSSSLYSYYIDLSANVSLNSNSLYALSVVNNYTSAPFAWGGSNSGPGYHLIYNVGQAMFLKAPGNLAFTLSEVGGATVSAVPEPDSVLLLGSGLLGLLGVARQRRAA